MTSIWKDSCSNTARATWSVVMKKVLPIVVEPKRALYGAWYELFPRSTSDKEGVHGTFKDVEARLPYLANMGF